MRSAVFVLLVYLLSCFKNTCQQHFTRLLLALEVPLVALVRGQYPQLTRDQWQVAASFAPPLPRLLLQLELIVLLRRQVGLIYPVRGSLEKFVCLNSDLSSMIGASEGSNLRTIMVARL